MQKSIEMPLLFFQLIMAFTDNRRIHLFPLFVVNAQP